MYDGKRAGRNRVVSPLGITAPVVHQKNSTTPIHG